MKQPFLMSTNKAIRRSIGVSNIDEKRARYHARPDEYKETDLKHRANTDIFASNGSGESLDGVRIGALRPKRLR